MPADVADDNLPGAVLNRSEGASLRQHRVGGRFPGRSEQGAGRLRSSACRSADREGNGSTRDKTHLTRCRPLRSLNRLAERDVRHGGQEGGGR